MRVLLINTNQKTDLLAAPPLGLCYVASAAEAAAHEVSVLDLCFAGRRTHAVLEKAIRAFDPQAIGLSIRNIDNCNLLYPISYLPPIRELVRTIRRLTKVPLAAGGSAVSLLPEDVFRFLEPDGVFVSNAETSFCAWLSDLADGRAAPKAIPGVGRMVDGRFQMTPAEPAPIGAAAPDVGRWVDVKRYFRAGASYNIQTKRGCPHRCIYCTYNRLLEGTGIRSRDPVDVVDEIERALREYAPPGFEFVDSVFNDPPDHARAILEEIVRRPWKTRFTAMGIHPCSLDRPSLDLMHRAGFRSFMITPDSASDTMLQNYRKGFGQDDVRRAAELLTDGRFAVWWYFLVGGPGETNATLAESLDFGTHFTGGHRPARHVAHYFLGVRLYPGTDLWDQALRERKIRRDADPLDSLWYVSDQLDLDRAIEQMQDAAGSFPGVFLGFGEDALRYSGVMARVSRLVRAERPYWQHVSWSNGLAIATGLNRFRRRRHAADEIRGTLRRQTASG